MITLDTVAVIVAKQRRDEAYENFQAAECEWLRYEHEYVAALKAAERAPCSI